VSVSRRHFEKVYAILITCPVLLPAAYLAVGLDNWGGVSRDLRFESFMISGGVALGAVVFAIGRSWMYLIAPAALVLFMGVLPFVDFSPVKPAVRAVREIRPGMSESEVREILARHFPENGRFKRPEIGPLQPIPGDPLHGDSLSFALDPHDGRYNAATVKIEFSSGRCVSAEFSPD
jgi:hypothetical protein